MIFTDVESLLAIWAIMFGSGVFIDFAQAVVLMFCLNNTGYVGAGLKVAQRK